MPWPLEPVKTHEFARGLEEILVVEEKRSVIEDQLTGQLYNWPVGGRPRVVGEYDENGDELLTKPVKLDVMLVEAWLIFDCPHCGQTIKLDRKDSVHPIECPACESAFEPLLDREVKLPPRKVPARSRRRRGSRGSSRRPSGSEGESEGGEKGPI